MASFDGIQAGAEVGTVFESSPDAAFKTNSAFIGPYRLLGELGRGAMARVWRAFDSNLQREVAIKEPLFQTNNEAGTLNEMGRRFIAEGRAAARLNHPGIVTIHAADVYDKRPIIVMELIDGCTLGEKLRNGPLAQPEALHILDQLLDAIGYAHSQGIVHRDIKPENIFINTQGQVKLADFGIAHIDNAEGGTHLGAILGTPGYMSPEQATGKPVDARSDLFSIGTVAYEMLTGINPFGAGTGADATTVMYRIVHEPAPALPASASAGLPADLRPAIMKALQKAPEDRPCNAAQFKAILHGANTSLPRTNNSLAAMDSSEGSSQKSRGLLPFVAVAALFSLALIGLFLSANTGGGGGNLAGTTTQTNTVTNQNTRNESSTAITSETGQNARTKLDAPAYLGVHGDYVAVYLQGRSDPYRTTTIPISELEPETAAKLGAGVPCNSLEDALARVDTFIEEWKKLQNEQAAETTTASPTESATAASSTENATANTAPQQEHSYEFVYGSYTWYQASEEAKKRGGYLACVTSSEEWTRILSSIPSDTISVVWLGASRAGSGDFTWVNGETMAFNGWASGEPNNDGGIEDCLAALKAHDVWGWYDVPNDVSAFYESSKMGFVIEYE